MPVPQREPDRPPRAAADSSTPPAVTRFSVTTSPVDSLSRSGDVRKYGGRWWFVPGRCDLTASGCCADPHPVPGDALQNNAEYTVTVLGANFRFVNSSDWYSRMCRGPKRSGGRRNRREKSSTVVSKVKCPLF